MRLTPINSNWLQKFVILHNYLNFEIYQFVCLKSIDASIDALGAALHNWIPEQPVVKFELPGTSHDHQMTVITAVVKSEEEDEANEGNLCNIRISVGLRDQCNEIWVG